MPDERSKTGIAFEKDIPVAIKAIEKPGRTLVDLLTHCDVNEPLSKEDRAWIDLSSAGKEL